MWEGRKNVGKNVNVDITWRERERKPFLATLPFFPFLNKNLEVGLSRCLVFICNFSFEHSCPVVFKVGFFSLVLFFILVLTKVFFLCHHFLHRHFLCRRVLYRHFLCRLFSPSAVKNPIQLVHEQFLRTRTILKT